MRVADERLWYEARDMDATVAVGRGSIDRLGSKRVRAERYSERRLFSCIAGGQPVVFRDFAVPVAVDPRAAGGGDLAATIAESFRPSIRARVQLGPARDRRTMSVPDVVGRWKRGRAIVSVTDLHVRGTGFERAVDLSALSGFNLLPECPDPASRLEIMSLVISSRGNVTESHTDDPDGSNHSFVGKKLWLAWDRIEGQARGLQDVSRDDVRGRAAFDMRTFASLDSARWFVVSSGDTLFLPGSMAHKVITLEPYLGIGGFYVALPGLIGTMNRWVNQDPVDVTPRQLAQLATVAARKIRSLQGAPTNERERWGIEYFERALRSWLRGPRDAERAALETHPDFRRVLRAATADAGPRMKQTA